jgi:hypothetical protein
VDLEAAAVGLRVPGELGFDRVGAADELDDEIVLQLPDCLERAGYLGLRRAVAAHRVNGDANHAQTSSTSTCFLPR